MEQESQKVHIDFDNCPIDIITGKTEEDENVVEQMIGFLTSPIARRKGICISADDCVIWAEELKNFLNK